MDAGLKAKWVEALRSGQYTQGKGALCSGGQYCCLGVLCDISGAGEWKDGDHADTIYVVGSEESRMTLPETFSKQINLRPEEGGVLWRMNDLSGNTFSEIADFIEAHL